MWWIALLLTIAGCDIIVLDKPELVCPPHYVAVDGERSRYRFIGEIEGYVTQRQRCAADGMHLAAIDTAEESAALRARAGADAPPGVVQFVVGVVQDPQSPRIGDNWYLVTGEPLDPALWGMGQPNDDGSDNKPDEADVENVAAIDLGRAGLSDVNQFTSLGAICECDGKDAER